MHAGSIHADTMESRTYRYLKHSGIWQSSMQICMMCFTPNVCSTIAGIRQQLPKNEQIVRKVLRWKDDSDKNKKRTYYKLEVTG